MLLPNVGYQSTSEEPRTTVSYLVMFPTFRSRLTYLFVRCLRINDSPRDQLSLIAPGKLFVPALLQFFTSLKSLVRISEDQALLSLVNFFGVRRLLH